MDLNVLSIGVIFAGGFCAGVINVLAGGGSLLSLPLLIFVGVPEVSANGSLRVAILVQGLTATVRFHRAGTIPWHLVARWAPAVMLGGALGASLAIQQSHADFRAVLGWVTLGLAALLVINPAAHLTRASGPARPVLVACGLVAAGAYGGYVQAGVGYLLLFVGVVLADKKLTEANVLKVVLVLLYTPVALLIFGFAGKVEISASLVLAAGTGCGAYVGAGLALRPSAVAWIRWSLLLAVLAAASKLLLRW